MLDAKQKQDAKTLVEEIDKMALEDKMIVIASINALRQRQIIVEAMVAAEEQQLEDKMIVIASINALRQSTSL